MVLAFIATQATSFLREVDTVGSDAGDQLDAAVGEELVEFNTVVGGIADDCEGFRGMKQARIELGGERLEDASECPLAKLEKEWRGDDLQSEPFPDGRLHVRAIIRDGSRAFVGSQSLRKLELDGRREIGIIVREPKLVKRLAATFETDWAKTPSGEEK